MRPGRADPARRDVGSITFTVLCGFDPGHLLHSEANTIELGGFSSAWLRDLAFYAGLEVKGDSR